jgi:hypothetical protein
MESILVDNVRCFDNVIFPPIKPITLLVGENSSGKSTFLALTRLAWEICQGARLIDFNEEPFLLGSYDQIAAFRGGRAGRAKYFEIGAQFRVQPGILQDDQFELSDILIIRGCFEKKGSQPYLKYWTFDIDPFHVNINYNDGGDRVEFLIKSPSGESRFPSRLPFLPIRSYGMPSLFSFLRFSIYEYRKETSETKSSDLSTTESELDFLMRLGFLAGDLVGPRPYAIAPIRTRPQRTYDPLKELPTPEGTHAPMVLAKTYNTDPDNWAQVSELMDKFGNSSGLFKDLVVRRVGRKASDPFQIRVKISGPSFNLVDVGYGVSQVLPILVDAIQERKGSLFLLQQPEVHLHPIAQAELGSFLIYIAKNYDKRFLIETHSDYLVDRIRVEIRHNEDVTAEDVSLLYFERGRGGNKIHQIKLDEYGNVSEAPPGYRNFFLEEERRILGGT